jgi:hypothetical protein
MIEIICFAILIVCVASTKVGSDSFYAGHVLLWVYAANLLISETEFGQFLEKEYFYRVQSVYSLIIICLLLFRFSKISDLLIALYTLSIFIHMLGYWMDVGYNTQSVHWWSILALYVVEIVLLMSKGIVDGCYRHLTSWSVFHNGANNSLKNYGSKDS